MSAKSKEIVEKVNTAFAENNLEGFLSFCADDVKWTMVGDKTVTGKDAIRQ
ncbi:MAG: nuclear transport factor 2 family protein [Geobacteraceae bacterium]|nr:nuclear transport factor 2 family protein [Geobacteraceae bacterium]